MIGPLGLSDPRAVGWCKEEYSGSRSWFNKLTSRRLVERWLFDKWFIVWLTAEHAKAAALLIICVVLDGNVDKTREMVRSETISDSSYRVIVYFKLLNWNIAYTWSLVVMVGSQLLCNRPHHVIASHEAAYTAHEILYCQIRNTEPYTVQAWGSQNFEITTSLTNWRKRYITVRSKLMGISVTNCFKNKKTEILSLL